MGVSSRNKEGKEQIQKLQLSALVAFKDHPFRVVDDDRMMETVESVKEYGVLVPIIARPIEDGLYEIISGRKPGEKFLVVAQMVGMAIVISLMFLAFGNDISRIIH